MSSTPWPLAAPFISKRWELIVASALASAVASIAVALVAAGIRELPDEGPFVLLFFVNPIVLVVASMYASAAIVLAVPLALVLLRPTQLKRTVPIVAKVTVASTAIGPLLSPLLGAVLGLLAGVVTMFCVWLEPSLREPVPERRRLGAPL